MILAGREEEVRLLAANCLAECFVVLTSEPGLGATEILRSGLTPALLQAGSIPVYFNSWEGRGFPSELKEAVAQTVRDQADDSFLAQGESLEELLRRVRRMTGRPVALLLDQFEDYLRFHSGTLSDDFDTELANAVNSRSGQFAVALQEHSTVSFGRLANLIPNLLGYQLQLKPLPVEAAREMVRGLAGEEYVSIDEAVVEGFVNAPAVQIK
ncbi:MAG TPA: hypothetical protein VNH18_28040, partial [Bryobacteraceae bacterium]|nr:hypothetical protein [Bryobacteraceae bacterium]